MRYNEVELYNSLINRVTLMCLYYTSVGFSFMLYFLPTGVTKAVNNVNTVIAQALVGKVRIKNKDFGLVCF